MSIYTIQYARIQYGIDFSNRYVFKTYLTSIIVFRCLRKSDLDAGWKTGGFVQADIRTECAGSQLNLQWILGLHHQLEAVGSLQCRGQRHLQESDSERKVSSIRNGTSAKSCVYRWNIDNMDIKYLHNNNTYSIVRYTWKKLYFWSFWYCITSCNSFCYY